MSPNNTTTIDGSPISISTTTSTSPSNSSNTNTLHALKLHEEHTAQRILHLQTIISNTSLGVVSRTKAKVELALLQKNKDDDSNTNKHKDEIAAIQSTKGVSKINNQMKLLNENRIANELADQRYLQQMYKLAMQGRDEARRILNEQRIRSAQAQEELQLAEIDAHQAMNAVKLAMEKLNVCKERAGYERKLLVEAQMKEEGYVAELKLLDEKNKRGDSSSIDSIKKKMGGGGVDNKNEVGEEQLVAAAEGDIVNQLNMAYDNELNALSNKSASDNDNDIKYWQEKCEELTEENAKLNTTIKDIQAKHERAQSKISSLELYVKSSTNKHVYWKEQSIKLSDESSALQQQKIQHETELQELKRKISIENDQINTLKAEIAELKETKVELEQQQLVEKEVSSTATDDEDEDDKLIALTREIMKLISDKEDALASIEQVKEEYESSLVSCEEMIHELQRDVNAYSEELKYAHDMLNEKTDETSRLHSSIDTIQVQSTQQERHLLQDQQRVVTNLESEVARLEDENDEQRIKIKKLKKMLKRDDMKEAFVMQDREINRLKGLLEMEVDKVERLTFGTFMCIC